MAAAGCAVCVAAMTDGRTDDKQERVKPAATQPVKVNTQKSAYSRLNTDGAEDGIPYGLRLMDVNDREVTLSWLSPEKTDGYWEDFETHNDFQINSPGSIGLAVYRRRQRDDLYVAGLHLPQPGTEDGVHRDESVADFAGDRLKP